MDRRSGLENAFAKAAQVNITLDLSKHKPSPRDQNFHSECQQSMLEVYFLSKPSSTSTLHVCQQPMLRAQDYKTFSIARL